MNLELMQQSRRRRHRSDRGTAWQLGRYLDPHLEARSRVHGRFENRAADEADGTRVEPENSPLAKVSRSDTGKKG